MDLRRLFYPEKIAVVGASPGFDGGKMPFFQFLQFLGYKGALYPVNPAHKEISGVKAYPSLDDVPEAVDLVIAQIPARYALDTVRAAGRKGVPFIHFFTSGFSEVGNKDLEVELVETAHACNVRLVGPNCIGVLCAESRITFNMDFKPNGPANVAFMGQSGGVSDNFVRMSQSRKIKLNKAVSYGNQADLRMEDFLAYFARDTEIEAVAAYVEDVKNGPAFLEALSLATRTKPVILLKGGSTRRGAKAAASHTGAMAGDFKIFSSVVGQKGGIIVDTFEQMMDLMMLATSSRLPKGARVGFLGAGGGTSVCFTDLAAKAGLEMPTLSRVTQDRISEKIPNVNTSTANPVDLGAFGFDFGIMAHTMLAMDQDENIDVIMPYFSLDFITSFAPHLASSGPGIILDAVNKMNKPVIPILSKFAEDVLEMEKVRIEMFSLLREGGLAVFNTIQDCVYATAAMLKWSHGR
ncbi:MAG: CoA-binding protein [Desulfatibacillum sp.]|nr:CoA-binding protein [Desulfatibacillum sp.]